MVQYRVSSWDFDVFRCPLRWTRPCAMKRIRAAKDQPRGTRTRRVLPAEDPAPAASLPAHRSGYVTMGRNVPAWIRTEQTAVCQKCRARRLVIHESQLLVRFLNMNTGIDHTGLRFHLVLCGCLERRLDHDWECGACQGIVEDHLPAMSMEDVITNAAHLKRLCELFGPSLFRWDRFSPMFPLDATMGEGVSRS